MRRTPLRALLFTLAFATSACGTPPHPEQAMNDLPAAPPPASSAQQGALGVSLGTVVTIEGVVFDGSETRTKELDGVLLVDVDTVSGAPLGSPVRLQFEAFVGTHLEPPAAGARVKWVVYETGAYTGVPTEAFEYAPAVSTWSFRFDTWLVVLRVE